MHNFNKTIPFVTTASSISRIISIYKFNSMGKETLWFMEKQKTYSDRAKEKAKVKKIKEQAKKIRERVAITKSNFRIRLYLVWIELKNVDIEETMEL